MEINQTNRLITSSDLRLGVNIDHVATLRQARLTPYPSLVEAAAEAVAGGADSITIHLREDRRHIQDADVPELLETITVPMNLELAATDEMVAFASNAKPHACCLVPEKREELTTEGGLDVVGQFERIKSACHALTSNGVRVSLFIAPDPEQIAAAHEAGAACIELHTGHYADRGSELTELQAAAKQIAALDMQVHAGHGLTVANVAPIAAIPEIEELNIGHALVARAVFVGLRAATAEMLTAMQQVRGGLNATGHATGNHQ